jgi:hypothetical protein
LQKERQNQKERSCQLSCQSWRLTFYAKREEAYQQRNALNEKYRGE